MLMHTLSHLCRHFAIVAMSFCATFSKEAPKTGSFGGGSSHMSSLRRRVQEEQCSQTQQFIRCRTWRTFVAKNPLPVPQERNSYASSHYSHGTGWQENTFLLLRPSYQSITGMMLLKVLCCMHISPLWRQDGL